MPAQITEKGRSNASDETAFRKKIHAAPKKAHKNIHEKPRKVNKNMHEKK
jgi:hypothetical protein